MDHLPRIPSPPGTLWREFRVTALPIVTFVAVLVLTVVTWRNYVGPSALVGEVEAVRAVVSAPQAGRLIELNVRHMERVSKGQLLGHLAVADPRVLQANLALSRARVELIRSSPVPELRLGNNSISYENLRLRWLEQRLMLATAKSDQTFYEAEFDRAEKLFADKLISQASLDLARKNVESTHTKIEQQTKLVEEAETAIRSVRPADQLPAVDGIPNSVRAAVDVEQRNLELMEAQLAPLPLIAPMDGVVSVVNHRVNETVPAGESILVVGALSSERIVAYLRQPLNYEMRVDQPVEVRARSLGRDFGRGRVLAVGSQLEPILAELLPAKPVSGMVEYGRPIVVSVPAGLKVLPGEIVDLRPLE
jgi:multidrug resistance efflux pump